MNRLIFIAATLSLVLTIANAQPVSDSDVDLENVEDSDIDSEIVEDSDDSSDSLVSTAINTTNNITKKMKSSIASMTSPDNYDMEALQEDEIATELANLITKTFSDISKISENMKDFNSTDITEASINKLVDTLVTYVEDTNVRNQEIDKMLKMGKQMQDATLTQLNSMAITPEDAAKMENELRKQMKLRLPNIQDSQKFMDFPRMRNMLQN